jgi:hypothetical protein
LSIAYVMQVQPVFGVFATSFECLLPKLV